MLPRILNIAWKDFRHLWHNRLFLLLVVFGGTLELIMIGVATGSDVEHLKMAVIDRDQSALSQDAIAALRASETLDYDAGASETFAEYDAVERDAALDAIFTGGFFGSKPVLLLEIPPGFGADLQAGRQPTVQMTFNGARSLASTAARRAAEDILQQFGAVVVEQSLARELDQPVPTRAEVEQRLDVAVPAITVRYNEELRRAAYTTPSETAFILGIITLMIASIMMAREREFGTFEQLLVLPMRPIEIIFGKAIPAVTLGLANFVLLLGVMRWGFEIDMRGPVLLLIALAAGYLLVELGRGFMIAMIARTQNQALLLVMLIAFVDITFSGYAVPVESMPPVMQTLANLFPIRHWMIILRGIMQKDVGLAVLWPQLAWLAVLGVAINAVTLWIFGRTLGETR